MGRKPTTNLQLPQHMRARVQKSGITYYYLDLGGKPRRELPLGPDLLIALKRYSEYQIVAKTAPVQVATFRYAADRYLREVIPGKATETQRKNKAELEKLLEYFDNPPAPLDSIAPQNIREYLNWRNDAPVRANRERALFSHIFNMAREWGYTKAANPCSGVQANTETPRDVYVDDDMYQALFQCGEKILRDAMDLAFLTGQRKADVLKLSETHIRDGMLFVTQNKTTTKLRFELVNEDGSPNELGRLLNRLIQAKREKSVRALALLVDSAGLPITEPKLRGAFNRARIAAAKAATESGNHALAAKVAEMQFRDLRAKAATEKADRDGILASRDQLGHSTVAMTETYIRQKAGHKVKPTR